MFCKKKGGREGGGRSINALVPAVGREGGPCIVCLNFKTPVTVLSIQILDMPSAKN